MTIDPVTLDHYALETRRCERVTLPAAYLAELVEAYRQQSLTGAPPEQVATEWARQHGAGSFRGGPVATV